MSHPSTPKSPFFVGNINSPFSLTHEYAKIQRPRLHPNHWRILFLRSRSITPARPSNIIHQICSLRVRSLGKQRQQIQQNSAKIHHPKPSRNIQLPKTKLLTIPVLFKSRQHNHNRSPPQQHKNPLQTRTKTGTNKTIKTTRYVTRHAREIHTISTRNQRRSLIIFRSYRISAS